jgi:hypothetical protein
VDTVKRWLPVVLCSAAAVLVLFPLSVYPDLFHRTPNTPLHLLVLDHLFMFLRGDVEQISHVIAADFPAGRPVRIIGWPFQLLALPLVPAMGRVAALNISLLMTVLLSGVLMARLLRKIGLGVAAQTVGATAWVMNPLLVSFLSNGQYENHVGWAFPLVLLGLMRGGLKGNLMLGIGLLGAAFSSPYQAIPVAMVLGAVVLVLYRRSGVGLTATLGVVFLLCYAYFSGPQPTPGGECGPTSGNMPLALNELFGMTGALHAEMPFQVDRWTSFRMAFAEPAVWSRELGSNTLLVSPSSGFLGLLPLIAGCVGMWRVRALPWVKPLVLAAGGCLLLALGSEFTWARGASVDLPMPADLLALFPGLDQMGTTLRFMTGVAFVLVVGLAFLVESIAIHRRRSFACVVLVLIAAEWVFGTVASVPMQTRAFQAPAGFDALPETGAVMGVPIKSKVPPEAHLWIGLVTERPVVGYCNTSILDYREQFGVVNYAQGGALPNSSVIASDFARLHENGISYLAFLVPSPGQDQFQRSRTQLEAVLGPADAAGDGVIGYRTQRPGTSPTQD